MNCLNKYLTNLQNLKIKKVRGQELYHVVDIRYSSRWSYLYECHTRKEASEFIHNRALHY